MYKNKDYFEFIFNYIDLLKEIISLKEDNKFEKLSLQELQNYNHKLYSPLVENSEFLFDDRDLLHKYMSYFAYELVTYFKNYIFKNKIYEKDVLLDTNLIANNLLDNSHIEYINKMINLFKDGLNDKDVIEDIKNTIILHKNKFLVEDIELNIQNKINNKKYRKIVLESDLNNPNYLYFYGHYVSNNELAIVDYFNHIDDDKIKDIAHNTIDGFKRGYVNQKLDLSKKEYVTLCYPLGFEKVAKEIINILKDEIRVNLVLSSYTSSNRQVSFEHKNDNYIYFNEEYVSSLLKNYENNFKKYENILMNFGGALWIENFGEKQFNPNNKFLFNNEDKKQELEKILNSKYATLYNKYTNASERSFTIISYPCPDIGDNFEKIFDETVKINNLDNDKYKQIQQCLIDTLDKGDKVHVKGQNGNKTDIFVNLYELNNPNKETIFENCTADVNIPVGEVFTTPILKGTNGVLNVSKVFLRGLEYKDLTFIIEDGNIKSYSCKNFDKEEDNLNFIKENILYNYNTLPIGEFAIGTNTTAYNFARKFNIQDKLDILIAEKTGPHFAFGDTCFSHQEELKTYNPDGKEIIAKENEYSLLRQEDENKAYFGCHTDITIPFDELELIEVVTKEGFLIPIIKNGKFVLDGTQELNKALE